MPDSIPISGLPSGTFKTTDVYPAVDVTDHTSATTGTTKKYTTQGIFSYLFSNFNGNANISLTNGIEFNRQTTAISPSLGASFYIKDDLNNTEYSLSVSKINNNQIASFFTGQSEGFTDFKITASANTNIFRFDQTTSSLAIEALNDNNTIASTPLTLNRTGSIVVGTSASFGDVSTTQTNIGAATAVWNANALQGTSVSTTTPTDGQVLTYSSSSGKWQPAGDLSGNDAHYIWARPINNTLAPTNHQYLGYVTGNSDWEYLTIQATDINYNGLTISSPQFIQINPTNAVGTGGIQLTTQGGVSNQGIRFRSTVTANWFDIKNNDVSGFNNRFAPLIQAQLDSGNYLTQQISTFDDNVGVSMQTFISQNAEGALLANSYIMNWWNFTTEFLRLDAQGYLKNLSTTGALLPNVLSTTQKTSLTPPNGSIVYDSTLNKINTYENGSWVGYLTQQGLSTNGQLYIGNTGNNPSVSTLTAGTGISITNGAGSITISATGVLDQWIEATAALVMNVNTGYSANNASTAVQLALPSTSAIGNRISIVAKGAAGFIINQNSGQNIQLGNISTTVGTGGSITNTKQFDSINLVCITANTTWVALSSVGNFTIV